MVHYSILFKRLSQEHHERPLLALWKIKRKRCLPMREGLWDASFLLKMIDAFDVENRATLRVIVGIHLCASTALASAIYQEGVDECIF